MKSFRYILERERCELLAVIAFQENDDQKSRQQLLPSTSAIRSPVLIASCYTRYMPDMQLVPGRLLGVVEEAQPPKN